MKQDYFISHHDYFWQWEQSDEIIAVIRNGNTIAYKPFLFDVIEKLAPQGLPPLGSLLLAIIATNQNGDASLKQVREIMVKKLNTTDDIQLEKSIQFLQLLSRIPAQYKTQSKRILLFQTIFQNCHNRLSIDASRKISESIQLGTINFNQPSEPAEMGVYLFDFRPLTLLAEKYESETDIIQKISGLPDQRQIEINFEEKPGTESVSTDLVDELIENDRTFTTGSLIRWLWAGLNIPVHSSLPSVQPIGGISDLTNKGDFDKLLISEFAYDDFTFLSRLANNEALYIHREIPPAHNDLHRIILIDASLKNWGTPKTIAFAVMLAIARHPKTDITCQGYVLGKEKYFPVSMESVDTIIDAMAVMNSKLDTSASLELFLKDHGGDKNTEVFFVSESTTMKHGALLRVLNEFHDAVHYLVLTDIDGNIDLYRKHQRSRKHVQHIQLPLNKLWQRNSGKKTVTLPKQKTYHRQIPILVKADRINRIVNTPDHAVYALTLEGTILKKVSEQRGVKGWDVITYDLPFRTNFFEVGIQDNGDHMAILYHNGKRTIHLLNLTNHSRESFLFDDWLTTPYPSFIFKEGYFYHLNSNGTWRISLDGKITQINAGVQVLEFNNREIVLKKLTDKERTPQPITLKNVNKVFINSKGELIINTHALLLLKNGDFRLLPAMDRTDAIPALKTDNGVFRFPEGSTVEVMRLGLIILRSSDPNLPAIFIPSFLDSTLGLATETLFAGNEYFRKDSICRVTLVDSGPNKLAMIKLIKETFGMGLQEAKEIADKAPIEIDKEITSMQGVKFREEANRSGSKVEVHTLNGSIQKSTLTPTQFHETFIAPFIQVIRRNYGS